MNFNLNHNRASNVIICVCIMVLASCHPTRKLKENEILLIKSQVNDKSSELQKDEVEKFIRQKPNRKLLRLFNFHVGWYNMFNNEKIASRKVKRNNRFDKINSQRIIRNDLKNEKRKKQGFKPKKLKLKDKEKPTLVENLRDIGEEPVLLDSFQTQISRSQIEKYYKAEGYFDVGVKDSIKIKRAKKYIFLRCKIHKTSKVLYNVNPGKPYLIKNLKYQIEDDQLSYYIFNDTINCLIKKGKRYDTDNLQNERERIVKVQKNNGYFQFNQDYIYYLVDTSSVDKTAEITLVIKKFAYRPENRIDTLVYRNHFRYYIDQIYLIPDADFMNRNTIYKDTVLFYDFIFLSNGPLKYKKNDIADKISFYRRGLFNYDQSEDTYKRLSDLNTFRNVNIQYKPINNESEWLRCFVYLTPVVKQNFSIETEGSNTSGNFGMAGSFVYQNNNTFRGAEVLELKLRGGLTAQKNFDTENDITEVSTGDYGIPLLKAFNTFQFGPELNVYVPKQLFPFTFFHFSKNASPKTIFTSSLNYQQNSKYIRTLTNFSYGFQFRTKKTIRSNIVPLEINMIKADLRPFFEDQLNQSTDQFLKYSFADHITTISRYTFTYNDQGIIYNDKKQPRKVFTYFKTNIESSGNILRAAYNLSGVKKDTLDRYLIFNIPFSQFLRIDLDYRLYKNFEKGGKIAFRINGGIGKPLNNLRVLPYEKSFFAGGPNSIRAWRARTVGPGSYDQTQDVNFDKIGDLQIELSLEYRFKIYKFLHGAWFIDMGNVWLRKPDKYKPGADFAFDRFYKEFATGFGYGLRADFSFFILRLDGAVQIYDPSEIESQRFVIQTKGLKTFLLNFGIGYPF